MVISQLTTQSASTAAKLLFERLPDRIFTPLASTNRHEYWALLCRMYEKRFGPDAPLPPSQGFLLREIVQDIQDELEVNEIWDYEEGDTSETPINIRAVHVFHRLEAAGWFRLEKFGVERRVTMRPIVSQFLGGLVSFAEKGPVFLSGKIRSIDLNIQQILEGKADGDTLSETAEQARNLLEHVRNTGSNVRDIMEALSTELTTGEYVRRFFNDYIEQVFIGDYRELRTKEHPLARRQQIIQSVEELSLSEVHRARLITWYETKRCGGDRKKAETLFEKDTYRLLELRRVDEYLERLDDEIRRANRRALAYLDYRLRSLRPVDHLVKKAIEVIREESFPVLGDPFPAGELICGDRLAEPRKTTERASPSSLRRQVPSEAQIARSHVLQRAREARSVTPPKLTEFVVKQLDGSNEINSNQLQLETIADVRSYQTLAGLSLAMSTNSRRLHIAAAAMAIGYRVMYLDGNDQGSEFIGGRLFAIKQRKEQKEQTE